MRHDNPMRGFTPAHSKLITVFGVLFLIYAVQTLSGSILEGLQRFWMFTGFANATWGHMLMIVVGLVFIFLAIRYEYEPLLLVPIGTGIIIGNIPFLLEGNLQIGVYEQGSVLNYL